MYSSLGRENFCIEEFFNVLWNCEKDLIRIYLRTLKLWEGYNENLWVCLPETFRQTRPNFTLSDLIVFIMNYRKARLIMKKKQLWSTFSCGSCMLHLEMNSNCIKINVVYLLCGFILLISLCKQGFLNGICKAQWEKLSE